MECLAKVVLPSHKCSNIGPKKFDVVFIVYAQNSFGYRFISLSDFSISEYRDVESFEHVFLLKEDVPHDVPNIVSESMNLLGSNFGKLITCLYMDDMLIFSTNMSLVSEAKRLLSSVFEMKDLGEANVILRIKLSKPRVAFPYVSLITLRKCRKDLIPLMCYL